MKKRFSFLLALSLTAGCFASGTTVMAESEYAGTTLTMMMSSGDFESSTVTDALNYCADKLGITLEYDVYPSDQYLTVLNSKLATGNAADLLLSNNDINTMPEDALVTMTGDWIENITNVSKAFCTDDEGNVKLAPLGSEANMGLVYNQDVLDAAGVTLPIANYDEFLDACAKIKDAGYIPVYVSNKESWTAQILVLCSMTPIFEKNPEYLDGIITNKMKPSEIPELVDLLKRVTDLRDLGYVNTDYMSATDDMGREAIANGEAAFYASVDGSYSNYKTDYPDQIDKIGMTTCPMWDDEAYSMIMNNKAANYLYVVNGKNADAAMAFVNEMVSDDCLKYFYDLNPGKAPYENLNVDISMSAFNEDMQKLHEENGIEYYAQWDAQIYTEYNSNVMSNFWGDFSTVIQDLFAGLSPEEALDEWYANYSENAKALRLDGWN